VLTVAFLHPVLGLGGAERAIVDAASGLAGSGHRVVILTAEHDPARAFPQTIDGSLDVRVHGRLLPAHVAQRLRAACAVARMAWLVRAAMRLRPRPDVVVCDLVAHTIPLARRLLGVPVVYYCHYPDRLLAPEGGRAYGWYRGVIDGLEARGIGAADRLAVNSRFTATRLADTYAPAVLPEPVVVHPGVAPSLVTPLGEEATDGPLVVLSLARFDPRKNVGLAIDALADVRGRLPAALSRRVRLVIAGGYDPTLRDQTAELHALERRVRALGLDGAVEFRLSPTDAECQTLLAASRVVVFTPLEEHFGYVPLEAMAAGRPVVAVNAGGPTETVLDGRTGRLCPPTPEAFGEALAGLLGDPATAARLGRAGRAHVLAAFSRAAFQRGFEDLVRDAAAGRH
jgi:alpha-1,3/alpha-1,6-mannosyltransferase